MPESIRYVGSSDLHDGHVLDVSNLQEAVTVRVEGDTGIGYLVHFRGVRSVSSQSPQGMMLYALTECDTATAGLYRFTFVNRLL